MDIDDAIRRLGERQYGLVARRQLHSLGLSWKVIRSRIDRGMLVEETPRVLRLAGTPPSEEGRLLVAVLHVRDSIVSHHTAAALWGISGFDTHPIHVSVTRNLHRPPTVPWVVHHATVIPEGERREVRGIPVASPGLTLVQIAGSVSMGRLERAVDNAWSLRLVHLGELAALLERMARSGRNGVRSLRKVLQARQAMRRPPQSNLETRFLQLMERVGIRTMEPQVDLGDERWTGRVDFRDDECAVVVEVQSERYHSALSDRLADEARHRRLRSAGFEVVTVWDRDLFTRPHLVVRLVEEARKRAT